MRPQLRVPSAALLLVFVVFLILGCQLAPVSVFAAASLADVMEEVGAAWENQDNTHSVAFHFAGSNTLARQIAFGAEANIFVSADRRQIGRVGQRLHGRPYRLAGNRLVVIAPTARGVSLEHPDDLLTFPQLAIADPETAPAGAYAQEWLVDLGLWTEIEHRMVPTLNVRAARLAVTSGAAPAGIVYRTDITGRDDVRAIWTADGPSDPSVEYWAAHLDTGRLPTGSRESQAFFDFLRTETVAKIFERHGFETTPQHGLDGP